MPQTHELVPEQSGERLDRFLAAKIPGLTRSHIQKLIGDGHVTINSREAKPSARVKTGDHVAISIPEPARTELVAQAMPLAIVYEDADLLVIDKPAGLAVHPGPGHPDLTLVNAILAHCPDLAGIKGTVRPGIVHRLDKDTSGLIVVAKNEVSQLGLARQIKDRTITKRYLALVKGTLTPDKGILDKPIGRDLRNRKRMAVVESGRPSQTKYRVLKRFQGYTLVEATPITGRTHQIRVHCAWMGHPIVGDAVYGGRSPLLGRQFLHAAELGFLQPRTGIPVHCASPLPPELQKVLDGLDSTVKALEPAARPRGRQRPR